MIQRKDDVIMYYLLIVQNNNTPAIFGYESYDAVKAAYHTELAYRAEGRTSTKCMILNSDLNVLERESWDAPVVSEPNEG